MRDFEELREAINRVDYPDVDFLRDWTLRDYETNDLRRIFLRLVGQYHTKILDSVEAEVKGKAWINPDRLSEEVAT